MRLIVSRLYLVKGIESLRIVDPLLPRDGTDLMPLRSRSARMRLSVS